MNLTNYMIFNKIKHKLTNGNKMNNADIYKLMIFVNNVSNELKYFKAEHALIFGKTRNGIKTQNVNYRKSGDYK
jgi:hypothetical protein